MRRRARARLASLMVGVAMLVVLGAAAASAPAATETSTIGATVASSTTFTDQCTDPAAYEFGSVTTSSTNLTATGANVCRFAFGSTNDTSMLQLQQLDGAGNAMYVIEWSNPTTPTSDRLWRIDMLADDLTGWAVGDAGTILKTTDGGVNWTSQVSNTTDTIMGIDALDANTAWASVWDGTMLGTVDGGTTWTVYGNTGTAQSINNVVALDANTVYATVWNSSVLKTVDGGTNWTIVGGIGTGILDGIAADLSTGRVWVGDQAGTVHYSDDGFSSMTSVATGNGNLVQSIDFLGDGLLWVAVGNQAVRSLDGGDTYELKPAVGSVEGIAGFDRDTAVLVGPSSLVTKTTTGGATWQPSNDPAFALSSTYDDVAVLDHGSAIVVGDGGVVLLSQPGAAVADYDLATTNWTSSTTMFGACLQALGGDALESAWAVDAAGTAGTCEMADTDPWNPLPAAPETVAATDAAGESGWADIVWGFQVGPSQQAGRYEAPLAVQVIAPAI